MTQGMFCISKQQRKKNNNKTTLKRKANFISNNLDLKTQYDVYNSNCITKKKKYLIKANQQRIRVK